MNSEKDFKNIVNRFGLDRDTFPYSEKGQRMLMGIIKHFTIIVITGIIGLMCIIGAKSINDIHVLTDEEKVTLEQEIEKSKQLEKEREQQDEQSVGWVETQLYMWTGIDLSGDSTFLGGTDEQLLADGEKRVWYLTFIKRALDIFGRLMMTLTLISIFIFTFRFLQYGRNIMKRQRLYERNVILNDLRADFFRRRLLNSLDLKARHSDLKRSLSDKSGRKSTEDIDKLNMFKTLRNTQVLINTRNDVDDMDILNTQHRIYINLDKYGTNKNQLEMIKKEVESWPDEATRLKRGKLSFGSMFISNDQSYIVFRANVEATDPYRVSDTGEDLTDDTVYEVVYPSEIFFDQQDKIDELQESAEKWSVNALKQLGTILNTKGVHLNPLEDETKISASSVQFVFEVPETSKLPDFSSIPKQIDSNFGTMGSSAVLQSNRVEILLPLPSKYHTPINVPTLFRDVFGEVVVAKGDNDIDINDYLKHKEEKEEN